jgi:hypothetical protein
LLSVQIFDLRNLLRHQDEILEQSTDFLSAEVRDLLDAARPNPRFVGYYLNVNTATQGKYFGKQCIDPLIGRLRRSWIAVVRKPPLKIFRFTNVYSS